VRPELQRLADEVLSTSQMAKYVDAHPDKTRYAILTECGLVVRMELDHPKAVLQAVPPLPVHEGDRSRERLHDGCATTTDQRITVPETCAKARRARCCA